MTKTVFPADLPRGNAPEWQSCRIQQTLREFESERRASEHQRKFSMYSSSPFGHCV
ncbi:protein of unknown function (plasmid) [Pararobbsia alpina]